MTPLCWPSVGLYCETNTSVTPAGSSCSIAADVITLWFQEIKYSLSASSYACGFRCMSGFIWLWVSSLWDLHRDRESASEDFQSSHRPRRSFADKSSSIHKSSWLAATHLAQDQVCKQQQGLKRCTFCTWKKCFLCAHIVSELCFTCQFENTCCTIGNCLFSPFYAVKVSFVAYGVKWRWNGRAKQLNMFLRCKLTEILSAFQLEMNRLRKNGGIQIEREVRTVRVIL